MAKRKKLPESLNICLVAQKFPMKGRAAEHGFLWPIAKGLASRGHRVTVLSAKSPLGQAEVHQDGVRAFYLHEGFPNYSALRFGDAVYHKFMELHGESAFHLVHSIDSSGYKIGKNRKHFKVAMAYDVEATQMSQIFSILGMSRENLGGLLTTAIAIAYKFLTTYYGSDRKLLRTANGIFVTSPQQRIALERYYLYPDFRTYTVPYGIELGDLSIRTSSEDLRRKLNIPQSAHIVVTMNDMTEIAEIRNVLDGFEKVAVKKPNARLLIVGNGPVWKDVEYEIFSRALGSRVIMTGAIKNTEIPEYISLADAYVNLSSRTTGFEPSMIEAMAQEKVIIGSEVSPISNIVEDGVDGFLLRPADYLSLATLLIHLFSGQISKDEIGKRARGKVINLFDTEKMVGEVVRAYQHILLHS